MFKRLDIQSEAEEEEDEEQMSENSDGDEKNSQMGGMTGDDSNMEGEDKSQVEKIFLSVAWQIHDSLVELNSYKNIVDFLLEAWQISKLDH